MEYKVGDVVELKSGGPAMTVTKLVGADLEVCWIKESEVKEI